MPVNVYQDDIAGMLPEFEGIRDVLGGDRPVKLKTTTYLPKLPGHKKFTVGSVEVDMYANYLSRARVLPFAAPLLKRLLGLVFRKAPTFAVPETMKPHLANLTLTAPAVTDEGFAKQVLRENLTTGHGGIMVDFDATLGRPYQRLYAAGSICGVHFGMAGSVVLPQCLRLYEKCREAVEGDPYACRVVEQWRVLELTTDAPLTEAQRTNMDRAGADLYPLGVLVRRIYRQREAERGKVADYYESEEPVVLTRRDTPLGFIPFVPFNPFGVSYEIEKPPFQDLKDLILSHYLNSADLEDLLHKVSAGTVLFGRGFSDEDQKKVDSVGGGSMIFAGSAEAGLEYVQSTGTDAAAIKAHMDDKKGEMAIAAGRLLLAQQKNVAESGASQVMQFAGEDADLQQITGSTAMVLEEACKIHWWWMGTARTVEEAQALSGDEKAVNVELNDQFMLGRISTDDMTKLGMEVEAGRMTLADYVYEVYVRGERGTPGIDPATRTAEIEKQQAEPLVMIPVEPPVMPAEGRP